MTTRLILVTIVAFIVGYLIGHDDGERRGRGQERAVAEARKDEHDAVMRKIGLCKWSQIFAEDIRCKRELPLK